MPREDRRIFFTFGETYKALYALCMQRELKRPPPGVISVILPDENDENKLTFKIDNMQDNSAHDVEYSRDFLAAALMLFCRSQGVPIPKRASKSVDLKAENVVLRMVI